MASVVSANLMSQVLLAFYVNQLVKPLSLSPFILLIANVVLPRVQREVRWFLLLHWSLFLLRLG